jgi:hypothetical protein
MRAMAKLLVGILLLAGSTYSQGTRRDDIVIGSSGTFLQKVPNATVRICTSVGAGISCNPLASVYSDLALTQVKANPFTTDQTGNFSFYAAPGRYVIQYSGAGITTQTFTDVLLPNDPASGLLTGFSTVTFSATPIFDSSLAATFLMNLTGNVTSSTILGSLAGRQVNFILCQDATGGRTFAWPASFLSPPTIGSGVNVCTTTQFVYDGTNWREISSSSGGSAVLDTLTVGNITLTNTANRTINVAEKAAGGRNLTIFAGATTSTGTAGALALVGGGGGVGTGNGGAVSLDGGEAGNAGIGFGGAVTIQGGGGAGVGAGGDITLNGGSGTPNGTIRLGTTRGVVIAPNINNTRYVDGVKFPCTAAGLASALADLPSTGGDVDASACEGTQNWSGSNPLSGITKPFEIRLGAGTYSIEDWALAAVPSTAPQTRIIRGKGYGITILTPFNTATNTNLIGCSQYLVLHATDRCDNTQILDLTIKAHASGSGKVGIHTSGMRFSKIDVDLQTNGTGVFASWIKLNANNLSYFNVVKVQMTNQANVSGKVVHFEGNGLNTNGNANGNYVYPSIWGNTGTFTAIDARASAYVNIYNANLENNASATLLIPGTDMAVYGAHAENWGTCIAPASAVDGASNRVSFFGGEWAGGCAVNTSGFSGWVSFNVNGLTFTNPSNTVSWTGSTFANPVTANANFVVNNLKGIFMNMSSGAAGIIQASGSATLQISGGTSGGQILNNAASTERVGWTDAGLFTFHEQLTVDKATGTAPFAVSSTTNVANLNASSLSGATFAAPGAIGGGTPSTGSFTTLAATGQITSTLVTGTAPFSIASTTVVPNLNVSQLLGKTWAVPDPIGATTPNTGAFSTLVVNTTSTFNGNVAQGTAFKFASITTGSIAGAASAAVTLTFSGVFTSSSWHPDCSVLEATVGTDTLRVHHIESITNTTNATAVVRVVNDHATVAKTGTLYCKGFSP